MISKMTRYDFVLYGAQADDFIEQLRSLGLVDITTTGWEPSDEDRGLLLDIDAHNKAVDYLRGFVKSDAFDAAAKPYADATEAFKAYMQAAGRAHVAGAGDRTHREAARRDRAVGTFLGR